MLQIRIRDPGLGDFWPLYPGWEKVSIRIRDPGWTTRIIFFKSLETIFLLFLGLKYLNSLRIRDPGWRQFGSGIWDPGWKKVGSGIGDKHTGSATLVPTANYGTVRDGTVTLKGSQRIGDGRIFLNTFHACLFNDNPMNEPNFDRIHLAGQWLKDKCKAWFLSRI